MESTLNINGTCKKTKLIWAYAYFLFVCTLFSQQSSFASVGEMGLVSSSKFEEILINTSATSANDFTTSVAESNVLIYVAEGTVFFGFDKISNVTIVELPTFGAVNEKVRNQIFSAHKFTVQKCTHKAHQKFQEISDENVKHTCFISKQSNKTLYGTDLGIQKEAIYNSSSFSDFLSEKIATAPIARPIYLPLVELYFSSHAIFTGRNALVDKFRRGPPLNQAVH